MTDLRSILLDPLIVPRIIIWSVVVGILSITVADPDLWGHVAFGRDIINTFELPVNDPYSFTADRPWVNHEWLSEAVMALAHQVAGPTGLSILKLMLLLTTFVLVNKELQARGVPPITRDVIAMACLIGSLTLTRTVRPQTFSLLFAAILIMAIRRAEERPRVLLDDSSVDGRLGEPSRWLARWDWYLVYCGPRTCSHITWRGAAAVGCCGGRISSRNLGNSIRYRTWRFLWSTRSGLPAQILASGSLWQTSAPGIGCRG